MSAGSMVAGGLAFTIPGIWMLGPHRRGRLDRDARRGTCGPPCSGLVCTALIQRHFVEESDLEYPIGTAAAETLIASRAGGSTGRKLFGSMAISGLWCVARDVLGLMPSLVAQLPVPGVAFGIQNSPMRWAVGFLAGRRAIIYWALGAVLGWFGIVVGGTALGLWDAVGAQGIVSSLGMGLMMGSGAGRGHPGHRPAAYPVGRARAVCAWTLRVPAAHLGSSRGSSRATTPGCLRSWSPPPRSSSASRWGSGRSSPLAVVLLAFVCSVMSAQSVGQSGIDPMEIFGLIVLLFVAAFSQATEVQLFFVAGVIAVACGLAGDVMSDFKTGQIIGTSPRSMWMGQAIGAVLGTFVAVAVLVALVGAYGPDAFGPDALFVSAQANVVATMVSGIPSVGGLLRGPRCRHGALLRGHPVNDARSRRVPAVLHVAHDGAPAPWCAGCTTACAPRAGLTRRHPRRRASWWRRACSAARASSGLSWPSRRSPRGSPADGAKPGILHGLFWGAYREPQAGNSPWCHDMINATCAHSPVRITVGKEPLWPLTNSFCSPCSTRSVRISRPTAATWNITVVDDDGVVLPRAHRSLRRLPDEPAHALHGHRAHPEGTCARRDARRGRQRHEWRHDRPVRRVRAVLSLQAT